MAIKKFIDSKNWVIPAIVIFILLSSLFYCDKLILGPYATIRIHDNFDSEFSRYDTIGKLLLKNGFFAWYPNIDCGMPAYAYHFPPYYILCLISLILPPWLLNIALIMFYMFIAAFGMFWFLKDFRGMSTEVSFLGGLLFSLYTQVYGTSVVCTVFNYAFPMFFMCLMAIGRRATSCSVRWFSLLFVILILSLSYPVLTIPMFCILQFFVISFLAFDTGLSAKKMLFKTILVWGGYILFLAPVLYSLYTFIPFSHRSYSYISYAAISEFLVSLPKNLIEIFLESASESFLFLLAIGLAPIVFYSRKVRRVFFALITLMLIYVFFAKPLTIIRGTLFEKMDLGHIAWIFPFLVILFVVTGIEEFFRNKVPKVLYIFSFLTAGLALTYFMRNFMCNQEMIWRGALNITVPLFIFLFCLLFKSHTRQKRLILSAVIVLFIVMLGQFKIVRLMFYERPTYKRFYESNSVFNKLRKEAEGGPFRVATTSSFPMFMQSYGLETIEARTVLISKRYKEFFREVVRPQLKTEKQSDFFDTYFYQLYLIDNAITPHTEREKSVRGLFNLPLLLMTNTKYIISFYRDPYLESISEKVIESKSDNLTKVGLLRNVFKAADTHLDKPVFKTLIPNKLAHMQGDTFFEKFYCTTYFIYQLNNYFDRGYLVPNAVVLDSDNEVLSELSAQSVESLKSNAFFLKDDVTIANIFYERQPLGKDERIDLIHYSPDKLIFRGVVDAPRILVISNNYHPNWRAIVNGKEQKVYRANHTFQAVFLEKAGNFNVTILYDDPLLWKMHWMVLFGIILIIYAAFVHIENDEEKIRRSLKTKA